MLFNIATEALRMARSHAPVQQVNARAPCSLSVLHRLTWCHVSFMPSLFPSLSYSHTRRVCLPTQLNNTADNTHCKVRALRASRSFPQQHVCACACSSIDQLPLVNNSQSQSVTVSDSHSHLLNTGCAEAIVCWNTMQNIQNKLFELKISCSDEVGGTQSEGGRHCLVPTWTAGQCCNCYKSHTAALLGRQAVQRSLKSNAQLPSMFLKRNSSWMFWK